MTAGVGFRWDEADRLFDQALELPPAERERWLDRTCDDPALRRQVLDLLRADAAAERFLELDGWRLAAPLLEPPAIESGHGLIIGPYRVVRELGRGGMGVVCLGERADGQFEHRVALKLIKRGMDSDEIHRRFLAERQILARLSHPHIARLLDGGVSAEGQPWFAIEYVDGKAITEHCAEHDLGVEERLQLFLKACEAVRYAHQHLVVHRDLKPSNILVTPDGQVKLLDFGIAKLLSQEPGAETGLTETGVRVMTPEYAAPEQVRGEPVTTATDVYALGTVLYELLTGQRAHRWESRTPGEMERIVCQVVPEAPSSAVDGARGKRLRGDLDTITLRALSKEPDRRYPTVEQLAADVRRHLAGQPVAARPDTWRYRATKFVARHRLGVAAAAAIVLSLLAGLGGTIWQARVAAERARVASAEAAKQRAVRDFLVQLFEASDPRQALGKELTASELLIRGRRNLDTALAGQPEVRAELLNVLGQVHRSLGQLSQADTLLGQAVALTRTLPGDVGPDLSARLTEWSNILVDLDEYDRADTLAREALDLLQRRGGDDPALARALRAVANAQAAKGNPQQAESLAREALAIDLRHFGEGSREVAEGMSFVGYAQWQAGDMAGADSMATASLGIWRKLLPPDHPTLLESLGNVATVRANRGDFRGAEPLAKEVLAGRRRVYPRGHPDVAFAMGELGYVMQGQERFLEAESLYVQALDMYRSLLGPDDMNTLRMVTSLAFVQFRKGELARAEPGMRESVEGYRRALGADNQNTLFCMMNLSNLLRERGRYGEAEELAGQAERGLRKQLGDSHPWVAFSLLSLGMIKRAQGDLEQAERLLREALAIERAAFPAGHFETARVLSDLGLVLNDRGKPGDGEPLLREALAARASHFGAGHQETAATRSRLGESLTLQGRYAEAETLLVETYRSLAERSDYWGAKEKQATLSRLVELYSRQGRRTEAAMYQRLLTSSADPGL